MSFTPENSTVVINGKEYTSFTSISISHNMPVQLATIAGGFGNVVTSGVWSTPISLEKLFNFYDDVPDLINKIEPTVFTARENSGDSWDERNFTESVIGYVTDINISATVGEFVVCSISAIGNSPPKIDNEPITEKEPMALIYPRMKEIFISLGGIEDWGYVTAFGFAESRVVGQEFKIGAFNLQEGTKPIAIPSTSINQRLTATVVVENRQGKWRNAEETYAFMRSDLSTPVQVKIKRKNDDTGEVEERILAVYNPKVTGCSLEVTEGDYSVYQLQFEGGRTVRCLT